MSYQQYTELDLKVKELAKTLRESYKRLYENERFFSVTSTRSAKGCNLSCYPKNVMDAVLNDSRFQGLVSKNDLAVTTDIKESKAMFVIRLNLKEAK